MIREAAHIRFNVYYVLFNSLCHIKSVQPCSGSVSNKSVIYYRFMYVLPCIRQFQRFYEKFQRTTVIRSVISIFLVDNSIKIAPLNQFASTMIDIVWNRIREKLLPFCPQSIP